MHQKVLKFSAGFATISATFLAVHGLIGHSPAQAETFLTRWTAVERVQKGDRLGAPAPVSDSSIVFYSDPKAALTIATKIEVAAKNESSGRPPTKPRAVPNENENARQEKARRLLVGCEPSFSPVTTPSMANVTGRCLAARDEAAKVAALSR